MAQFCDILLKELGLTHIALVRKIGVENLMYNSGDVNVFVKTSRDAENVRTTV